ncbi:hypothetical protein R3I93_001554 [Phoxinus phoxinus]|uniref:Uncharacterized protein n=1 Tax=Phoxinus phoxinus TaxID=58324 RepID=A0AAN9DLB2_9TELE
MAHAQSGLQNGQRETTKMT